MSKKLNIILTGVQGGFMHFHEQHQGEQRTTKRVLELQQCSVAIGAEPANGAVVFSRGDTGHTIGAAGTADTHSAVLALTEALEAGMKRDITLAVTVPDNRSHEPLSDDVLEVLSQFENATVLLVGYDRSVVVAKVSEPLAA